MEPIEKRINYVGRKIKQLDLIQETELLIFKKLAELSFSEWWNYARGRKIGQVYLWINLIDSIGNKKAIKNNTAYDEKLTTEELLELFNDTKKKAIDYGMQSDFQEFVTVNPQKQILKIVNGQPIRKMEEETKDSLAKFVFWVNFRLHFIPFLAYINSNKGKLNEMQTREDKIIFIKNTIDELPINDFTNDALGIYLNEKEIVFSQSDLFEEFRTDVKKNEESILEEDKEKTFCELLEKQLDLSRNGKTYLHILLFATLNTELIPSRLRKDIVDIISKSVCRNAYQNEYNEMKSKYYSDALNWHFNKYRITKVSNVLPDDFDKDKKFSLKSLKLSSLTKENISKMYFELISKKYITPDTDILDFAYALSGKPMSREVYFKKVNWKGREKKTLAIFLGLLNTNDRSWFWNRSPELFLYNGTSFTAKQLSSSYGKYKNHPETRKEEWKELESIINFGIHNN